MGTPPIQMASLGMADTLILMVMALVVFGPRRLPQIGRQIGKLMYEFRKASNDFKFQMEEELRNAEDADRRKKEAERVAALAVAAPAPKLSAPEAMASLMPAEPAEAEVYPPAEAPAAEQPSVPAEETYPRIMPPSTGEQVLAARPNSLTALAKAARDENAKSESAPASEITGSQGPDTPKKSEESEQAAQHA
jgi:sec-independent protein translocase protein TatB